MTICQLDHCVIIIFNKTNKNFADSTMPPNKCSYLWTQITASTMPDFSISIAIVVTIPVHWAPKNDESCNVHEN